jgi:hypothetical protein
MNAAETHDGFTLQEVGKRAILLFPPAGREIYFVSHWDLNFCLPFPSPLLKLDKAQETRRFGKTKQMITVKKKPDLDSNKYINY